MTPLQTAVDIANRALDHVGQDPIGPQGFNEPSKKAKLMARLYNNLRRSELQRRVWTFSSMRTVLRPLTPNTMRVAPVLWSSVQTYFIGSVVSDAFGTTWSSNVPDNRNQEPGATFAWDFYSGPLVVFPWDAKQTYWAGELAYIAPGDGSYRVYRSKVSQNTDDPATPTPWSTTDTYNKNQIVSYLGVLYMSLINLNTNRPPNTNSPALWDAAVTYNINDQVRGADGFVYLSSTNANINNNPLFGGQWNNAGYLAAWDAAFPQATSGVGSSKWLEVFAQLTAWDPVYPVGAGPDEQSQTLNAFDMPANFLREAPQDPRAGSTSYLGAPWGLNYDDYKYENGMIVSWKVNPIIYRFVADFVDVRRMTPMFIEGLAWRMAYDACEPLTQSADKAKVIGASLQKFIGEAGIVDGIEQGPVEAPVDDYIACRG